MSIWAPSRGKTPSGSWATLGIWPLVDFIVALVKLGKYQDDFVFDNAGKWVEPAAH